MAKPEKNPGRLMIEEPLYNGQHIISRGLVCPGPMAITQHNRLSARSPRRLSTGLNVTGWPSISEYRLKSEPR